MLEHKHLLVTATIKNPPKEEAIVLEWVKRLITNIGMEVAELSNGQSNPIAWYSTDPDNQGMTAGGILTTSHTMLHTWDNTGGDARLEFDLYSCKDFDVDDVLAMLNTLFGLKYIRVMFVDRNGMSVDAMFDGEYHSFT